MGVESPLVCDILHTADENGLMQVSSKADFSTASTTTTTKSTVPQPTNTNSKDSEKEYLKFTLEDAITESKPRKESKVEDDQDIYDSLITAKDEDYDFIDDEDE